MVKYISKFKFIDYISFLLGIFIFLPFKVKPLVVIVLFLFFLNNIKRIKTLEHFYFFYVYFLIVLSTLIYTINLKTSIDFLVRILPFLFVPAFFSILNKEELNHLKSKFIKIFIYSNFLYALIIWPYLYYVKLTTPLRTLDHLLSYITYEFYGINEHPIYISSYMSIAVVFLILNSAKKKMEWFILFFLLMTLLLLTRKMIIITIFLIIFSRLLKFKSFNFSKILIATGFLIASSILTYFIPEIHLRFLELIKLDFNNLSTSTGTRFTAWQVAFDVFIDYWQFGVSWGDSQDFMNKKYVDLGLMEIININTHNQYLQILLSSGIIGFLILKIEYIKLFLANYKQNIYFTLTQIIFLSIFLVESYLERQNGIIFFVIITCLFIKKNDEKNTTELII